MQASLQATGHSSFHMGLLHLMMQLLAGVNGDYIWPLLQDHLQMHIVWWVRQATALGSQYLLCYAAEHLVDEQNMVRYIR